MAAAIDELKKYPNWVCFRLQKHPTKPNKFKKPIISPVTGKNGSHSNPAHWTTYEKAKAFFILNKRRLSLKGLGFVFSDDVPIVGIDLDDCVINGKLNAFAQRQIKTFNSYTEWSYSGNGVHILGHSDLLFPAVTSSKRGNEMEIYSQTRFFVVTGKHIEGTPKTLENITRALAYRVQPTGDAESSELDEVTIDDVVEMLACIPGEGLDYSSEWLRILMAIHSSFPGADGFAAVENWTGPSCQPNELQQKWNSFRKDGIGIGTLIHFAREYGYESKFKQKNIQVKLERIKPRLTPVQEAQVADVIEELAEQRAWEIYHEFLMQEHLADVDFPKSVLEHFQIGWREREVIRDTGEVIPDAVTVPYYVGADVVGIEFRHGNGIEYDGEVGLYVVRPMFEEEGEFGVVLPDSLSAINFYLSGDGVASVYGLPQTDIVLELPDEELFCIFDGSTPMSTLEVLDAYGAKFVRVRSVETFMKGTRRQMIEVIARRGKKLSGVV